MKINPKLTVFNISKKKALKILNADRFLGEFYLSQRYGTVAMFYSENPDLKKGHKPFPFIFSKENKLYIGALSDLDFQKFRYYNALFCHKCENVIYSKYRHDFQTCRCESISIDGGKDYIKVSAMSNAEYEHVTIDFFDGTVIRTPKIKSWWKKVMDFLNEGF